MNVYLLTITHKHGADSTVYATRAKAEEAVLDFVSCWWGDEMPAGVEQPPDPSEALAAYFDQVADREDYRIEELPLAIDGPTFIVLDPDTTAPMVVSTVLGTDDELRAYVDRYLQHRSHRIYRGVPA